MSGKHMRLLARCLTILALASSLAVMGACGAVATAGDDKNPGTSTARSTTRARPKTKPRSSRSVRNRFRFPSVSSIKTS
jgi:hypothetical protein